MRWWSPKEHNKFINSFPPQPPLASPPKRLLGPLPVGFVSHWFRFNFSIIFTFKPAPLGKHPYPFPKNLAASFVNRTGHLRWHGKHEAHTHTHTKGGKWTTQKQHHNNLLHTYLSFLLLFAQSHPLVGGRRHKRGLVRKADYIFNMLRILVCVCVCCCYYCCWWKIGVIFRTKKVAKVCKQRVKTECELRESGEGRERGLAKQIGAPSIAICWASEDRLHGIVRGFCLGKRWHRFTLKCSACGNGNGGASSSSYKWTSLFEYQHFH